MNFRSSNITLLSSLAILLSACGSNAVGDGSTAGNGASSALHIGSEIKYTGDCTPDKCANQDAACVGGTPELTCAPSPYAGTGSVPAGSCELTATCDGAAPQ